MSHGICTMRRFPYNIVWLKETYHNIFQFEFEFEFEGVPLSVLYIGAIFSVLYFQLNSFKVEDTSRPAIFDLIQNVR